MDPTAHHYSPDSQHGQSGYYSSLAAMASAALLWKAVAACGSLWGCQMSLARMLKNFPFFCWRSRWFALVKRFLFINYGWPLMFRLVHRLALKWPEKWFSQTSSHCRNYLYNKKILHSINIYSPWQILLAFYLVLDSSSFLLADSTLTDFFWVEALRPHPCNKCLLVEATMATLLSLS